MSMVCAGMPGRAASVAVYLPLTVGVKTGFWLAALSKVTVAGPLMLQAMTPAPPMPAKVKVPEPVEVIATSEVVPGLSAASQMMFRSGSYSMGATLAVTSRVGALLMAER